MATSRHGTIHQSKGNLRDGEGTEKFRKDVMHGEFGLDILESLLLQILDAVL